MTVGEPGWEGQGGEGDKQASTLCLGQPWPLQSLFGAATSPSPGGFVTPDTSLTLSGPQFPFM